MPNQNSTNKVAGDEIGTNQQVSVKVNGTQVAVSDLNGMDEPDMLAKELSVRTTEPSKEVVGFALMLSYECIPTLKILATGLKSENGAMNKKVEFNLTVKNAIEISLTLAKTKDSELFGKMVRRGILQGPDRTTFVVKAYDFRTLLEKFLLNFSEAVKKDKECRTMWEQKLKQVMNFPYYSSEVVVKKGLDVKKCYFILLVESNKLVCITCTQEQCKCEIPQAAPPVRKVVKEGGNKGTKYVGKLQAMSKKLGLARIMTTAEYNNLMETGIWKEAKELPSRKRLPRNVDKPISKFTSECEICKIRFIHEKIFLFHLQSCNYSNNGKISCPSCRRTYDTELGIIKHLQISEFCGSSSLRLSIKSDRRNSTDSEFGSIASSSDIPDLAHVQMEDAEEDAWDNISVICEVEDDDDDESGMLKLMMRMEVDVWVTVDELLMEGGVGWTSQQDPFSGENGVLLHSPNEETTVTYQALDTEDQGGKLVVVKGPGVLEFCGSGWSVISSAMECVVYDKRTNKSTQLPMVTREVEDDTLEDEDDMSEAGQFMFQRPTRLEKEKPWSCFGCGIKFQQETSMLRHTKKCKFCALPEDLRNPVRTEDGKIGCLGCRKTWKDIGQCYYKHVTSGCKRVKPGKFVCKKCKTKLSTNNSLEIHKDQCGGHSDSGPASRRGRNGQKQVQQSRIKKRTKSSSSEDSDDSDTPLSKRRRTNSSAKAEIQETTEYHSPVCKIGSYKCPICGTRFKLNQPYGRHVQSLGCSKARLDKEIPEYNKMLHVTIHPGNHGTDSTMAYSQVPSLKMISRGYFTECGFSSELELPPPSIKEAIEMNYSIKHSDDYKELDREERWRYFHHRRIFTMVASSKDMISSCISILKIINFFENKIQLARASHGADSELVKNWNNKMSQYLNIDYHDNINTTSIVDNFRVIEYAKDGKIACLCLLCPEPDCVGCFTRKIPVKQVTQPKRQVSHKKKSNNSKKRFYGNQFTNTKSKSKNKSETKRKPEPPRKQARVASPAIEDMTPKQVYQARYRLKQRLNRVKIPTENEYYYHAYTGKFLSEAMLEKQHAELSKKLGNRQLTFQEFLEYKFQAKSETFEYYADEYDSPPEDPEDDEYKPQSSKDKRRSSKDSLSNNTSHKQKNSSKAKAGSKTSKKDSSKCFYCQYCEIAFQNQTILMRHQQGCSDNPQNFETDNIFMEEDNIVYEEVEPIDEDMSSVCAVQSYCSLQNEEQDPTVPVIISPNSLQVVDGGDGGDPLDGLSMDQDPLGDCILPD